MGKLTALAVKNAKPGAGRIEVSDGQGLYLVVQPSGAKSWAYRYRNGGGQPRKLTLGNASSISLEVARTKARKAATDVDDGKDPAAEKRAARSAARVTPDNKVETVVASFIERHAKTKTRTWRETQRILEKQIVSRWRGKPLAVIRTIDIHHILDAFMDQGKPAAAQRYLQAIRPMFKWAVKRGVITSNPCEGIDPPATSKGRERALLDDEIRIVWRAADALGYPFGPIVKLLILLGQRRNEVSALARSELDIEAAEWVLPSQRSKNSKPHLVPLPSLAVSIFEQVPQIKNEAGYLFTTTGKTVVSGFSKAKSQIDNWIAAQGFTVEPWTLHDLRRSFATGCARLGVQPHVVEAILNHKSGTIRGVAAIYNRYDHAAEKRAALDAWAAHLSEILKEAP